MVGKPPNVGRIFLVALAACGVIAMGILGYTQLAAFLHHQELERKASEELRRSIAESTATTKLLLKLETDPGSVTYGELFERGDKALEKLAAVDVLIETSTLGGKIEALKKYSTSLQEILRLQLSKNRKLLALSNATDLREDAFNDHQNLARYDGGYAYRRFTARMAEVVTARSELKGAESAFYDRLDIMRSDLKILTPRLSDFKILVDGDLPPRPKDDSEASSTAPSAAFSSSPPL